MVRLHRKRSDDRKTKKAKDNFMDSDLGLVSLGARVRCRTENLYVLAGRVAGDDRFYCRDHHVEIAWKSAIWRQIYGV